MNCPYCGVEVNHEAALLKHYEGCWAKAAADKWSNTRVHGLLDDIAIVLGALHVTRSSVVAAACVKEKDALAAPTIVVAANNDLVSCSLYVIPGRGIQWAARYSDIGDGQHQGQWQVGASTYEVAPAQRSTPARVARVAQSLMRIHQAVATKDLSRVYGNTVAAADTRFVREALVAKPNFEVVGLYTGSQPHAEMKLIDYVTRRPAGWVSQSLGIDKLCCALCTVAIRCHNTAKKTSLSYVGSHNQVVQYWNLPPELVGTTTEELFDARLRELTVTYTKRAVEVPQGKVRLYVCEPTFLKQGIPEAGAKQVRRRSDAGLTN